MKTWHWSQASRSLCGCSVLGMSNTFLYDESSKWQNRVNSKCSLKRDHFSRVQFRELQYNGLWNSVSIFVCLNDLFHVIKSLQFYQKKFVYIS